MPCKLLGLLIISSVISAEAAWKEVSAGLGSEHYINPESKRKTSKGYKAWFLTNLRAYKVDSTGRLLWSYKDLMEFDCKDRSTKIVASIGYSAKWGNGVAVYEFSNKNAHWMPVAPDTINEGLLTAVCVRH